MLLTHARLLEVLHYDPETGVFRWRTTLSNRARRGAEAGSAAKYRRITVDGEIYRAARLAWFYVHAAWPVGDVDHINGVKTDDRLRNLRDVSRRVNNENQRVAKRSSGTGLLGASLCQCTGRYVARITTEGRSRNLGRFDTPEEAHAAYIAAKRKYHEGNTL